VALASPALHERVKRDVLLPTLEAMRRSGSPFTGVLYAGLMIDPAGVPWVVEFNCRFGDPEAQVILPLISDGLTDCLWRVAKGERPSRMDTSRAAAVTTVLASRGYPEHPENGSTITLPESLPEGVTIFHAGTQRSGDGVLRVEGGRVLTVTAVATSFREAQQLSRDTADAIEFDGKLFRADIGWREAARLDERRPATVRRG